MHIDHVAMYVNDLEATRDFFLKYFEASCGQLYYNTATGFRSYFLTFQNAARLELMNKSGVSDADKSLLRAGYTHIAFSAGSRENVDNLTAKLKDDGFCVLSSPRVTGDGYYESCIVGIKGNQIEITI